MHVGHAVYGLAALKQNASDAARALVAAADDASPASPLWVQCWGGAGVLAEALNLVEQTRDANATAAFVQNIRVYSISDQDDAGMWIRERYPNLFYVVSLHSFSEYGRATWNGISGEMFRWFDRGGPDSSLVTNEWLQTHIRIGELGAHYRKSTIIKGSTVESLHEIAKFDFIMEGDTPAFFPLIQNGLGDPEHPEWGNWGGRWKLLDQSRKVNVFTDATDWVIGINNETYLTSYGTIWRWRREYQFDFASRMQWSLGKSYEETNHAPVAIINGSCGPAILELSFRVNETIVLDASDSWDPDNDALSFKWFHYFDVTERVEVEVGESPFDTEYVTISSFSNDTSTVKVTPRYNHVS